MKEDIAIIGMACRFPGADDLHKYADLLAAGKEAITTPPDERFGQMSPDSVKKNKAGFINNYQRFDADFFKINPNEAALMDPQQRLMLEVSWQALEDANIKPSALAKREVGVFIGVMSSEWSHFTLAEPDCISVYAGTGNGHCMIANRLSYAYDFTGPSVSIDSACSSSLLAVHFACKSLLDGESELAIAGGVNVILSTILNEFYAKAGILSKDGKCKPFGSYANGIVRGEGGGTIILKKLNQAMHDKDRIYAIIKGSAINHDGKSNGITAPSKWAQIKVIRKALAQAQIEARQVHYIEAHGTGTNLGDPIEASALAEVFGKAKQNDNPCLLGSVKGNIGHLEGAAGIAGFIKTALSLYHQLIYPSINYGTGNHYIDFNTLNLNVVREKCRWPQNKEGCFAGVSSFGLGGANAHVVLRNFDDKNYTDALQKALVIPRVFSGDNYWIKPVKSSEQPTVENLSFIMRENLIEIIANVGNIQKENINENSDIYSDLNFDSLMIANLLSTIKIKYGNTIPVKLEDLVKIRTVKEIIDLLT